MLPAHSGAGRRFIRLKSLGAGYAGEARAILSSRAIHVNCYRLAKRCGSSLNQETVDGAVFFLSECLPWSILDQC